MAEAPARLLVASTAINAIVSNILRLQSTPRGVPLAVLLAPLARHFSRDLERYYAVSAKFLVIERISAIRHRAVSDGDRLTVEASVAERGTAELRLLAGAVEAFRCELQQLEVTPERLSAPKGGAQRHSEEYRIHMVVEPDQHEAYADASGDYNPLHMDSDLRARLGMPERIVHGTLLATLAETIARAGDTGAMTARFASPCFVSEALSATIGQRPGDGRRVAIHGADGRLVCAMDWRP